MKTFNKIKIITLITMIVMEISAIAGAETPVTTPTSTLPAASNYGNTFTFTAGATYTFDYQDVKGIQHHYKAVRVTSFYATKKAVNMLRGVNLEGGFGQWVINNLYNINVLTPEQALAVARDKYIADKQVIVKAMLGRVLTSAESATVAKNAAAEFDIKQAAKA